MQKFIGALPTVAAIGIAGGVTGMFIDESYVRGEPIFYVMTAVAAAVAGACVVPLFGKPDNPGWLWAFLGGLIATFGASTFLGLLINAPFFVVAPFTVLITLALQPLAAICWFFFMGLAHVLALHWRQNQKQSFSQ